jgi:hypothetical protein
MITLTLTTMIPSTKTFNVTTLSIMIPSIITFIMMTLSITILTLTIILKKFNT